MYFYFLGENILHFFMLFSGHGGDGRWTRRLRLRISTEFENSSRHLDVIFA